MSSSMLHETAALLQSSTTVTTSGSGSGNSSGRSSARALRGPASAPSSAANTPLHKAIKLEDHRPGRQTTISLLMGISPSISPPRSPSSGAVLTSYQSGGSSRPLSRNSGSDWSLNSGMQNVSLPSSSPYKFGDGTTGYTILFPTPEEDAAGLAAEEAHVDWHVTLAIWLSLIFNIALFLTKTYSAIMSESLSVAASAVDSFLDLASQGIVFLAERGTKHHDSALYPAGRSRLEPVGIILCAALMGMAALQLILESVEQLYTGYVKHDEPARVVFTVSTLILLALTIVLKLGLWAYCAAFAKYSPTLYALELDHRNDVLSNVVALVAALLAWRWSSAWSADPIGAILMSGYIAWNWSEVGLEQIEHIVGRAADPDFVEEVRQLATNFHPRLVPDLIRAYHFGVKYLVELEVILPADMTVREAHDISLALQQSIEQLGSVERAFVHVDYKGRDGLDEHDAKLIANTYGPNNNANGTPNKDDDDATAV